MPLITPHLHSWLERSRVVRDDDDDEKEEEEEEEEEEDSSSAIRGLPGAMFFPGSSRGHPV